MGGVEQVINQIARGTSKLNINNDVLSLTPDRSAKTMEIDGYLAHRARLDLEIASMSVSASAFVRFAQLAKKADVIHYHFPWPFMDVAHFVTRVRKPTVVTYQSDIIRQKFLLRLYRPLMWKFMRSVTSIVATSPNYLASSDVLQKFSHKVRVIPIGLDKSTYCQPAPQRLEYWRQRLGPRFFLFVGVLRYYKGLHLLLEAAQGLDCPIAIVGAGPSEQELKKQAMQLNLRNVHFLGHLPEEDKVALLTQCYGLVFPSHLRSEAFGVSLLEGAMYGKPMISCEIGTGTTFINLANETGLVIPPNDPGALHRAMSHLWEHPDEAAEMGVRAEKRYRTHFTAEQMARSYVELYRDLTRHQPAGRVGQA